MRITADTNLLVRVIIEDDELQGRIAEAELKSASLVAIPVVVLCEAVWTLSRAYKLRPPQLAEAIRRLINASNVSLNRPAVEAGLAMLDAGGDFADGVIAYEGNWLGAETFVSFDRKAVEMLTAQGEKARLFR